MLEKGRIVLMGQGKQMKNKQLPLVSFVSWWATPLCGSPGQNLGLDERK